MTVHSTDSYSNSGMTEYMVHVIRPFIVGSVPGLAPNTLVHSSPQLCQWLSAASSSSNPCDLNAQSNPTNINAREINHHQTRSTGVSAERFLPLTPSLFLLKGNHKTSLSLLSRLLTVLNPQTRQLNDKGKHPPRVSSWLKDDGTSMNTSENQSLNQVSATPCIIYAHSMPSTQSFLTQHDTLLPHGILVVASHQSQGRGRGQNQWQSQSGCAQFSILLHVFHPSSTHPSDGVVLKTKQLLFLQYLASLAVVRAVYKHAALQLRIKWPNDIYTDEADSTSSQKLGGILITSQYSTSCHVVVGFGLNVGNSQPTTCLHDLLRRRHACGNTTRQRIPMPDLPQVGECIGWIVQEFHAILNQYLVQGWMDSGLKEEYERVWLHQDQPISATLPISDALSHHPSSSEVQQQRESVSGVICGLDEEGWLQMRVSEGSNGRVLSLQPDAHSLDLMSGMIVMKK